MFQNDVTKNYELQDATGEILLMLAGAFLLGFLFCWALRKLRGDSDYPQNNRHDTSDHKTRFNSATDASATQKDSRNNLLKGAAGAAIGTAGAIGGSIATAGSSAKDMAGDIGDKVTDTGASLLDSASDTLNTAGDKLADAGSSITDSVSDATATASDKLGDIGSSITETVSDTVSSAGDKLSGVGSGIKDSVTNTVDAAGDKLSATGSSVTDTISNAVTSNDNFKKIEGIGPKIEAVLYAAGINTYADLRESDTPTLKAILDTAGSAFKMHDPETWPYQADLAYNEKWDKLKEYQDFLMGAEE